MSFLMAALHGAFALAERDHPAMDVGEDLNLHMARLEQIFFDVDAAIAKTVQGFGGSVAKGGGEFFGAIHKAHAFAAAAGNRFQQNREAHVFG